MIPYQFSEREIKSLEQLGDFLKDKPALAMGLARRLARDEEAIQTAARIQYLFGNCTNAGRWSDIAFDARMFGL